jgi:hypothetical protein
MHNKFSCGHAVLENNLRENSSLSYLLTKPTKQVFKFVRTKTETCALKLETIRGPSALSVYMSNLCLSRDGCGSIRLDVFLDFLLLYCIKISSFLLFQG